MSKYRDEFILQLTTPISHSVCEQAIAGSEWKILGKSETRIVCQEHFKAISYTNPATLEVILKVESPGSTRVILNASNFGFGPLQSGNVKKQAAKLRNMIETEANEKGKAIEKQKAGQIPSSLASELEKLSKLREQSILSEDEFRQAKAKLLGNQ